FRTAARVAAAAGLSAAGFPLDRRALTGHGARISSVMAGSPADGVLRPGDVVVAAGGDPVRLPRDLQDAVASTPGGRRLRLALLRDGTRHTVRLAPRRLSVAPHPVLGVSVRTHRASIELPIPVRIEPGRVGGPSAGLVVALTVYDKAERSVDLAGGRQVAATGTLDVGGEVGPVGGVEQKAVAASRAGVDVFVVPASQEDDAVAALPADDAVRVVGVATLGEAIRELRRRETAGRLLG
ncbi:MAG: PDZ domain-containing protein, partial [Actinomycetota bacterium]|nr:PDZ domain-containing protein [Actinomycetota bacterium]